VLTAVLVLAGEAALAQPPARRAPGGGPRDDAFRMVDAYLVSNLQESVGLSDEQFVKALPLVKRFQADRRELADRRRRALRELRELLQAGGATEARVAEKLRDVKALETEEVDKLRQNLEAIDGVMTPVQQAKFRIMQLEVEQKIREILQEVRQRRRGDRSEP
jgi:hypothetical protein